MTNNLRTYLKDLKGLDRPSPLKDDELIDYSVKYIRSLFKGKVIVEVSGVETVRVEDVLRILDSVE